MIRSLRSNNCSILWSKRELSLRDVSVRISATVLSSLARQERLVTLIGEAAARLPSELRTAEAHVPWIDIIGMRNRIMHGYDVIDYDIVWGVLSRELPPFETNLRDIIARLEQRR